MAKVTSHANLNHENVNSGNAQLSPCALYRQKPTPDFHHLALPLITTSRSHTAKSMEDT